MGIREKKNKGYVEETKNVDETFIVFTLLELGTVLLLQAANLIHINRVEAVLVILLVRRQLLLGHRLKADGGILTNTDDENTRAPQLALLVDLVRNSDVDFWDVVGRVGWGVGVGEHWVAVASNENGAGTAIVFGLDGETVEVCGAFVHAKLGLLVVVEGIFTHAVQVPLTTAVGNECGDEAEEESAEAKNDEEDGSLVIGFTLRVPGHDGSSQVLNVGASLQRARDVGRGRHDERLCCEQICSRGV